MSTDFFRQLKTFITIVNYWHISHDYFWFSHIPYKISVGDFSNFSSYYLNLKYKKSKQRPFWSVLVDVFRDLVEVSDLKSRCFEIKSTNFAFNEVGSGFSGSWDSCSSCLTDHASSIRWTLTSSRQAFIFRPSWPIFFLSSKIKTPPINYIICMYQRPISCYSFGFPSHC